MPRYSIMDWESRYEVDDKGAPHKSARPKRCGPLEYIRLKVHGRSLGLGWRKLVAQAGRREAPGVFGIFCKLLEIAGDGRRDERGFVDDTSETPLHFLLDLDEKQVSGALAVLCKLGWITQDGSNKKEESSKEEVIQLNSTQLNTTLRRIPGSSRNFPETPGKDSLSEAVRLADLLLDLIRQRKPDFVRKGDWAKDIDLMIRMDNRAPADVEAVIRWSQADCIPRDGFCWANNILSGVKLRKHFDRLDLRRMQRPGVVTETPEQQMARLADMESRGLI